LADPIRLALLTTGRQDYGILRSTTQLLQTDTRFAPEVWAGGMHLSSRFGRTIDHVRADSRLPVRELGFLHEPPHAVGDAAKALAEIGVALEDARPDLLLVVGDRSESLAAGVAATLVGVPIAHLHGGEETEGAIDNACRHALTKLSHLHLVSHARHGQRVLQMGENPASVRIVGAPGVDNFYRSDLPDRAKLEEFLGLSLEDPVALVTVHPATLGEEAERMVTAVASAMERVEATYIITCPNADRGGEIIRRYWMEWATGRPRVRVVDALGELRYWAVLRRAAVVLGNSSSGIIEAPAAGVPVVNVGERQRGRLRIGAVRDVPANSDAIEAALREAISGGIALSSGEAPYPSGPAAPRIIDALVEWRIPVPPRKTFRDI
jgi:UDP-N-acetylglucosamine 2-epimerase (non-hydrolysing)/GDP/UDP-N,N'-diacetylbacillosamine 2-epimerase (hydrolysing)